MIEPLPLKSHKFADLCFISIWSFTTIASFLLSLLVIEVGEKSDLEVVDAAIGGLAIAIPQSYILRRTIPPLNWIISTVLGWVLITIMGIGTIGWFVLSSHNLYNRVLISIIDSGIGGLIIGLSQSCLAIPPSIPQKWSWVFVNAINCILGFTIGSIIGILTRKSSFLSEVFGLSIGWLIVGVLTSISANRFLKIDEAKY
ncbi:hypothetical protein CEP10_12285 [Cylindrospermopsis raciborskii S07]|uniref:Uncharacterized protein n=1 Tax=Cylindrospermopsis raciborskii CS-505 TaxID=533240 RepID=A0A853M6Q8_9CYAN|nr:hypothetical protein [Cylindrospermopsis raciborskii]PNK04788.1 hypothetical protein CEP10_12285 [Cylindrospermopsis raciborskii S07]PNK06893.1 hypothetical protein CEP11_06020 [Cylindrospermopsis raciborskii S10]PNK10999.1 hypothetical protein CEP12_03530 [Cylindrospermopsis raciborskii S14]PNK11945.1 hypothetical protein CEP08_18260 [Cylindrospermopsis raciborskii S05]PNK18670.1 hypothetical protein CEP07_08360 [Cylindrospermopsis raciborskii S01]